MQNSILKKYLRFAAHWLGTLLLALIVLTPAWAAPNINQFTQEVAKQGGYDVQNVTPYTLSESVGRVIKVALSLVGTIFLVLTIYAGLLWMTASGNEERVEKATKILKAATIGLIIVISAYGLTVFALIAVGSAGGQRVQVGSSDIGAKGFWTSFGKNFKNNWWRYVFP